MATNCKITVGIGAVLVLRGTTITHKDDNGLNSTNLAWAGIVVQGNSTLKQKEAWNDIVYDINLNKWVPNVRKSPNEISSDDALRPDRSQYTSVFNQGLLILEKERTENNAKFPKLSHMGTNGVNVQAGGLIISVGETNYVGGTTNKILFKDNFGRNIFFGAYAGSQYSIIRNTAFYIDPALTNVPATFTNATLLQINSSNNFFFPFLFNYFQVPIKPAFNGIANFSSTGISGTNAIFYVYQNFFSFLNQSITLSNCPYVDIATNDMWNPSRYCIRATGGEVSIFGNEMYMNKLTANSQCIWLQGTKHDVSSNRIHSSRLGNNPIIGCLIDGTNTITGRTYNNYFLNFDRGLEYDRSNSSCTFGCNRFDNHTVNDVFITGTNVNTDGVPNQGTPNTAAMNWFNTSFPNQNCHINNQVRNFIYYHNNLQQNGNREYPGHSTAKVTLKQNNGSSNCSCYSGWVKPEPPAILPDGATVRHNLDSVSSNMPDSSSLQNTDDSSIYFSAKIELQSLQYQLAHYYDYQITHDTDTTHIWPDSLKIFLTNINKPWSISKLIPILIKQAKYSDAVVMIAALQNQNPAVEGQGELATVYGFWKDYAIQNYDSIWFLQHYSTLIPIAAGHTWGSATARGLIIDFAQKDSGALAHKLYPHELDSLMGDDTSSYSLPCNTSITAAPNPFSSAIAFSLGNADASQASITFKVVDLFMQDKFTQNYTIDANNSLTITPNLSSLTSGYYYAVIYCSNVATSVLLIYKQ